VPPSSPIQLDQFHSIFPGGIRWRVTPDGVDCEGSGRVPVTDPVRKRASSYVKSYGDQYAAASKAYGVPIELLIACSLTEASPVDPEKCCREEPGFVSDASTPNRVSAGFCQLLISTAREVMKNPNIDRKWLFDVGNSLRACAALIKRQSAKTYFDPVCVACAYNAGGLYENQSAKNRWRLRQHPIGTSKHADRFVENFNAAVALVRAGALGDREFVPYASLLAG
jgi:hypothetical protein